MRLGESSEESGQDEYVEFSDTSQGENDGDDDDFQGRLEICDLLTFRIESSCYLFTKRSYLFMIQCLQGEIQATTESILNIDPSFPIFDCFVG